jgi:hypothetical protein
MESPNRDTRSTHMSQLSRPFLKTHLTNHKDLHHTIHHYTNKHTLNNLTPNNHKFAHQRLNNASTNLSIYTPRPNVPQLIHFISL